MWELVGPPAISCFIREPQTGKEKLNTAHNREHRPEKKVGLLDGEFVDGEPNKNGGGTWFLPRIEEILRLSVS
jgi:hypothetical protein